MYSCDLFFQGFRNHNGTNGTLRVSSYLSISVCSYVRGSALRLSVPESRNFALMYVEILGKIYRYLYMSSVNIFFAIVILGISDTFGWSFTITQEINVFNQVIAYQL